jgi:hypothetical protein
MPLLESFHVAPALERLKQKDHEFETNLGYTVIPCLKNKSVKK